MTPARPLLAALLAGAVAGLGYRLARATGPGRSRRWARANHAGDLVTLLEGPAYAVGASAGASLGGPAPALATALAGGLGALDDLAGNASSKGLRGHLAAAARGEVTTGLVKAVGLAGTGVAATVAADRCAESTPSPFDSLVGGAVVAGSANLVNLLDLRPGRALKVLVLAAAPLALAPSRPGAVAAAAALGAGLAMLGPDLRGEAMLGDTGANAAGSLVGAALVQRTGRRGRLVALGVLTAVTLASEKVSFTRVIEATPALRALDDLGRARS